MDGQDWNPIVLRSFGQKSAARGASSRGAGASSRYTPTEESVRLRRLESEDMPIPTKHLSSESRTEMIRARTTKGMTQVQLNTGCAFPIHTIRDIENGKLCPTSTQMNTLKRILGINMKYA